MSIGPTSWSGVVGSLASTPAKNSTTEKMAAEAAAQLAAIDAATRAAADGSLQENEAAGDRDGDGRDPGAGAHQGQADDSSETPAAPTETSHHSSLDATGNLGHHLDLDV